MSGDAIPLKYRAFLVSGNDDAAWGDELRRALETARIAADLVGRETAVGPSPKTLAPIFRYGPDAPAGQPLTEAAAAALAESLFLVVLCSPDGAKNEAVNEAVRRFKAADKGDRVIPVIVSGEPGHAERECFPPALRVKRPGASAPSVTPVVGPMVPPAVAPAGDAPPLSDLEALSEPPSTIAAPPQPLLQPPASNEQAPPVAPLVIDARVQGDGREEAVRKLTAALLGVSYDEVVEAAARLRRRRTRRLRSVAAAALLIAALGGGLVWLRYGLPRDDALLNRTLAAGPGWAIAAVDASRTFGLPRSATLFIADASEKALRDLARRGADTPTLRYRQAAMLLAFARQDEALGRGDLRRQRVSEAAALLIGLKPAELAQAGLAREAALAQIAAGQALLSRGLIEEALATLRPALAAADRRAAAEPVDPERQRDLSLAKIALGDALAAKGASDDALRDYQAALAIRERLVGLDPRNDAWRRDLSLAHERVGDALLAKGDQNGALKAFRTSLAMRLSAVDPDDAAGWQRQLSVAYNKIGEALAARAAWEEALGGYRTGLALQLAAGNRDNAARRDLSVSYERIGDALRTLKNWDEALAAYRASLAIRQRLAAAEPGNPRWDRDLPVSHERVGDALTGRGAFDEAIAAYRASLALREQAAAADPASVVAQRDLAVSYNKIGDAFAAKGASEEAVKNFRAGLAVGERLVALDPANAQLQWDLLVLQWRLASSGDDPASRFKSIVATMRDLAARQKLSVEQARWLPAAEQELARVQGH